MKSLLITISIGLSMALSGCAGVFLVGAGVGAGAFSYISGNLTRVYEADYQDSINASINVMKQLNFKRKEESGDRIKTIIEGSRDYDTPITIEVVYVDEGWTQIGVRTGYLGIDNLEISEQIHGDIADQLRTGTQRTLRATTQKQKATPSESGQKTSQTQYDALPPPPPSASMSTTSLAGNSEALEGRQEKLALFPIKSKNKTFIYYPKSSLAIPPGAYGALDDIVSYLGKNPSAKVDIRGYTDSSGNSSRNLALSKERAFQIRDYLIKEGIAEQRISAQGLGATNFLESNRTERLRTMNRRVEIIIK